MLNHPTLDKLETLRFNGMAKALTEQMADRARRSPPENPPTPGQAQAKCLC